MNVFRVGVVLKPHGVKGAVKVYPTTDDPKRFSLLKSVRFGKTEKEEDIEKTLTIEKVQFFKNQVIVKFKEMNTPEEAETLRNGSLWIPDEDAVPLKENEFYLRDFLEAEVYTDEDVSLGKIYDILSTGSNEVFVVRREKGSEILLPVIKDVVVSMDAVSHRVIVHLWKGMLS